ncbi:hypothetical protein FHL15_003749 [Xylaria flabelliformis]|uniref:Mid2 domain-containing protein n=1 Tax=Xylaria flabelliformis TaxID=2512241 RepID=A0A553I5E2_9PEZI|nr:hypothetical protein FHL15_003749 [Xylaria flabelliformis]
MALALRLTALSYVVAYTDARWFQTAVDAGDWAPVTPTSEPATSSPDKWTPKTTSAPDRRPFDWELRRRDGSSSTICGYSVDDLDDKSSWLHRAHDMLGIFQISAMVWRSTHDILVSYAYAVPARLRCAAQAASGDIVVSPGTGSDATTSTASLSTFTTTDGIRTTTVTVSLPGNQGSSTAVPSPSGGSGSRNTGAIAGGVVGGVAGLALIIAAIFFFLYRRKRRSQASDPLALGRKMPPSDHHIYPNEPIPGSQYPSTFYGEAPPGMVQTVDQPMMGYPPNPYAMQNTMYAAGNNNPSMEVPAYLPPRAVPSKPQDEAVSPLEESPVSPVSPAENYNTMVSALSNQSPPLQPLQPAVHRQQSEYAQYSPPPPEQYQSYRPYPGT